VSSGPQRDLNFRYRQEINFYSYRLAKRITLPQNREVIVSKLDLKNDNLDWEEWAVVFLITQGEIQDSKLMTGHERFIPRLFQFTDRSVTL